MSRSDVFDEFVKIAMEKGLISEGEAEHTEQNTKSPRWDSLDLSAIEALYGVKPDQIKDMEYEHNIMEVAHPNSCVIAPAYDKLHGLVENEMERQNIDMHISYKEPMNGSPNQGLYPMRPTMLYPNTMYATPKYASKDLMMSLVRVANDMDNKDNDELRVLADTCLEQLHTGIKKQAFLPWLIGAGVVLAIVYLQQHLDDVDQGMKQDYSRLQSELQDFQQADTTLGFGHKYDAALKHDVGMLQSTLNEFWTAYSQALPLIQKMESPTNAQDLLQKTQSPETMSAMQAYEMIRGEVDKLYPYLDKIEQNFSNPDYKAEHTEKGAVTNLLDSVPFLHGGKSSLTADDFDDVVNAIGPFRAAVKRLLDVFAKAKNVQDKVVSDLSASTAKTQTELGPDPFKNPPAPVAQKEKTVEDIDNESKGLGEQLKGLTSLIPGFGG